MIFGKPHITGDSRHTQDRYAREMHTDPIVTIHCMEERPYKSFRREFMGITFTEQDALWVCHLHHDALVVITKVGNNNVHKIML